MTQQSHSWAYTQRKLSYKKTCTLMFIAVLCTITSTLAQPFSLLNLQFHTPSWLFSISINMYQNLIHFQRCSPQFPAFLLTLFSHSQPLMSTSYRNCLHVLTFHLHFNLKVLSCACPHLPTPQPVKILTSGFARTSWSPSPIVPLCP